MENNWPETVEELLEECQRLISKWDLYTLGEYGEPFTGEETPRVDGTEYLAGEYRYGVAMIPAQWVRHVLSAAALGSGTYVYILRGTDPNAMPSYGGETNELLAVYATREAAEKAMSEWRGYCDLNITEWEVA